ncbi:MAG: LCP family protein [Oscillospiraceae bacterium]|nr:LCP family protein [Oscillospiraceae bacterium]
MLFGKKKVSDENTVQETAPKRKRQKITVKQWIILGVTAVICGIMVYNIAAGFYLMTSTKRELTFKEAISLVLPHNRDKFKMFEDTELDGLYSDPSIRPTEQIKDDQGNVIGEEDRGMDYLKAHQINILIMGLDENKSNTDIILVASIDLSDSEETRSISLLQIPRDTFVGEEYAGSVTGKINGVYSVGNQELTPVNRVIEVISKNFAIPIDHYITCDLDGFKDIVDALGGIPMNVPHQITYDASRIIYPGEQVLSGEQSEWFVRYRSGYNEGDIGREKWQRLFMAAFLSRVKDIGMTEMYELLPELTTYCTSDMTVDEFKDLIYIGTNMELEDVSVYMVPGEAATYNGYSVWSVHKDETALMLNEHFRKYQGDVEVYDLEMIELANTINVYENTQDNFQELLNGETPGQKNEEE